MKDLLSYFIYMYKILYKIIAFIPRMLQGSLAISTLMYYSMKQWNSKLINDIIKEIYYQNESMDMNMRSYYERLIGIKGRD